MKKFTHRIFIRYFSRTLLFFWLAFIANLSFAQKNTDSLKHQIDVAKSDSSKVLLLSELIKQYESEKKYPEAITSIRQIIIIETALNRNFELAFSYRSLGTLYRELYNHDSAIWAFEKAYIIFKQLNEKIKSAVSKIEIGSCNFFKQNYEEALSHYLQSYKEFDNIETNQNYPILLFYISKCYEKLGNYKLALEYNFRLLRYSEKNENKMFTSIALNNIGSSYLAQELPAYNDTAMVYFQKAMTEAKQSNVEIAEILTTYNIASYQYAKKTVSSSSNKFRKMFIIPRKIRG